MAINIPPPTIVIFDMDGTVVRHMNPWVLNVLEGLDDLSYKIGGFITRRFGLRTREPFKGVVNRGDVKKRRLLVHRAIHFLRRKEVDQIVEPCPKIIDVLEFLKARDIPVGIASNGMGKGYGHDILQTFDLQKYFQATIFREDIEKAKPNPEAILRVTDNLFLRPTRDDVIWYIGDRWKDIQATHAAEQLLPCRIVPFAYGLNASLQAFIEGKKLKLRPEQRLVSYEDMLDVLNKLYTEKAA